MPVRSAARGTASSPQSGKWHAASRPEPPGISTRFGRSVRHRDWARGQRGWKAQPEGGSIALPISPPIGAARARRAPAETRHRIQKCARVRVRRVREQRLTRREFHQPAEIQHAHAVGEVVHHPQIVADEQAGEAPARAHLGQQVQDLALQRKRPAPIAARRQRSAPGRGRARARWRCAGAGHRRIRAGTGSANPPAAPLARAGSPRARAGPPRRRAAGCAAARR